MSAELEHYITSGNILQMAYLSLRKDVQYDRVFLMIRPQDALQMAQLFQECPKEVYLPLKKDNGGDQLTVKFWKDKVSAMDALPLENGVIYFQLRQWTFNEKSGYTCYQISAPVFEPTA